jgi:hypothetical protein
VLCALPAKTLRKVRHLVTRGGVTVAIDELEDGTLLAEIDDQAGRRSPYPAGSASFGTSLMTRNGPAPSLPGNYLSRHSPATFSTRSSAESRALRSRMTMPGG